MNGASFDGAVSPGCLITIFGSNLAVSTTIASGVPLPRSLGDATVTVDGLASPLYFVSAGQINAQIPYETNTARVSVVVTNPQGKSNEVLVNIVPAAPGIFTKTSDGQGGALIFDKDFQPVGNVNGVDTIILYATGLGPTNPPAATGAGGGTTSATLNYVRDLPEVYIGDERATDVTVMLAPGFAGVYQINVKVPVALFATDRVFIRSKGWQSNITHVDTTVAPVSGVTGTIDAVYPFSGQLGPAGPGPMHAVAYSPLLEVGKYSLRLNIPREGGVFSIGAVCEAARAIIKITAQNTYEFFLSTPSAAQRAGDFNSTGITPVDFATGIPMAGGTVPLARLDVSALNSLRGLPLPNDAPVSDGLYWSLHLTGSVVPGSTFVIDTGDGTSLLPQEFGAFMNLAAGPFNSRTAHFKLYVNGVVIASTEVKYPVVLPAQ